MIPASDILPALVVAALYLALFGAFELLGSRAGVDAELTRKGVHVGAGIVALAFPSIFASHFTVLVLGILFGVSLVIARRLRLLPSVHGVARVTFGELLYPVAVYGTLLLTTLTGTPQLYTICILMLALGDGLAGIVGTRTHSRTYSIPGGVKSIGGSLTFLIVAAISVVGTLVAGGMPLSRALLVAAVSAPLVTGLEAIAAHGVDNITVALGGWCVLTVSLGRTNSQLVADLALLLGAAMILLGLLGRVRRIGVAGAIIASLATYGAWILVDSQ